MYGGDTESGQRNWKGLPGEYFKAHVMNMDKDQDMAQEPGGDKTAKRADWDSRTDRWQNWGFQSRLRCGWI